MARKAKKIKVKEPEVVTQEPEITIQKTETTTQEPEIITQPAKVEKTRLPNAPYRSPNCEICKSEKTTVYSQRKAPLVRYIRCKNCGWTFKD